MFHSFHLTFDCDAFTFSSVKKVHESHVGGVSLQWYFGGDDGSDFQKIRGTKREQIVRSVRFRWQVELGQAANGRDVNKNKTRCFSSLTLLRMCTLNPSYGLIFVLCLIFTTVNASVGDRSKFFINCIRGCLSQNCTDGKSLTIALSAAIH